MHALRNPERTRARGDASFFRSPFLWGGHRKACFGKESRERLLHSPVFLVTVLPSNQFPSPALPGSGDGTRFHLLGCYLPFDFAYARLRAYKLCHLPPDMPQCPVRTFAPREAAEGKSQTETDSCTTSFLAQLAPRPSEFEKRMRLAAWHGPSTRKC